MIEQFVNDSVVRWGNMKGGALQAWRSYEREHVVGGTVMEN